MNPKLPRLFLFPAGTVALTGFFMILHARTTAVPYAPFETTRFPWTVAFVVAFLVASYGIGLPDLPRSRSGAAGMAVVAAMSSLLLISLAQLTLGSPLLPRMVISGASAVLIPWAMLCWRAQTDADSFASARVFAVAEQEQVAELRSDLVQEQELPAEIVGWLPPAEAGRGGPSERRLLEEVLATGADILVMDVASQAESRIVHQAAELHRLGIRIRTLSLFSEEFLGKIPLSEMERMTLLFDIGEVHRLRYVRTKRVFDVAIALVGMVPLLLAIPLVALADLIGNRGPLFYSQIRVGKSGSDFRIYKFRSMTPGDGPTVWTDDNDVRVTRFGSLLRKSHMDELPQIWNILKGDLSIVGPRPEQRMYVDQLESKLPYYEVRHLVRPGLTGWAQTKYGYGSDDDDAREKLQYDLYYLRRQSLILDFRIVARTVRTLLLRHGR